MSLQGLSPIALDEASPDIDELVVVDVASRKQPTPDKPTRPSGRTARKWTDLTGRHQIIAEFGGMAFDKVRLIKLDGEEIQVDFNQLSAEDQEWIKSRR